MDDKEKKVSVQKFTKIIISTISLIVIIMSLWIILDCFKKTPDRTELIMNYKATPGIDYKVYLKPNKFYEQKFLTKDKKYISNIIDYIDLDFSYYFNSSKRVDATYKYNVDAYINSQYELNGVTAELWKKNYVLTPSKSKTESSVVSFDVKDKIRIDYNKYDNLAKKFREEYGVMSDTKLVITIDVSSSSKIVGNTKGVNDSKKITLTIPLNKAVTDVTISGVTASNGNVTEFIKGESHTNYVLLIPSIILLVISLPICFISFYKLFKITNVSQYIVEQKKILKNYSEIIAQVTTKPDLHELKIIEVKDFEDLINIEEELRVPILYYELTKEFESWFVITVGNQAYRYILKSNMDAQL